MANELSARKQAKKMFDSYYDITPLDTSLNDSVKDADTKILKDIEVARRYALINVDVLIEEHNYMNGIKWNIDRTKYWQTVKMELNDIYKKDDGSYEIESYGSVQEP